MRSGWQGSKATICLRRSGGVAVAITAVLGACAGDSPDVRDPVFDEATRAAVTGDTLQGLLRVGEQGLTFQACDSADEAWVVEAEGANLRQAAEGLTVGAGVPVMARFIGAMVDPPGEGPGAAYGHAVFVTQWAFLAEDTGGCRTGDGAGSEAGTGQAGEGGIPSLPDRVLLRALGNEPFWNVDVERGAVRITRLGFEDLEFPAAEAMPDGSSRTWSGENAGHWFELAVEQRPCADTMVDRTHEFAALLTLDGQQFRGCAFEALDGASGGP